MILIINSGSTSLKYKLFTKELEEKKCGKFEIGKEIKDHKHAIRLTLREIGNLEQIKKIGHRVVHGGLKFTKTLLVNKKIVQDLEKLSFLAPLHNPANLAGIKACLEYLPKVKNLAVFDTAFFSVLPKIAYTYALPKDLIKAEKIRRFGFHGISHQYASEEAARKLKKPVHRVNLIICHLGGGSSISAIKKGQPIDTSMGFTPMEGLVMLTRSGDLDPGIIFYLLKQNLKETKTHKACLDKIDELYNLLNYQSGLYGLSACKTYLDLLNNLDRPQAQFAFNLFVYRIKKYIGAYLAILGKIDAIVFTGQIGAGVSRTRQAILQNMPLLKGVKRLWFETNEEMMIAKEVNKK